MIEYSNYLTKFELTKAKLAVEILRKIIGLFDKKQLKKLKNN